MLKIFLGENSDAKLEIIAKEMKKTISDGREAAAIVPDQFSFAFDKALYNQLGPRDFNKVTALSFRRLSESLINRFGTLGGSLVSRSDRMIILWLALKKVKAEKSLKILSKSAERPSFCADMSSLFDSFRRSGITAEALKEAAASLGGTLSDKLSDISEIYGEYAELMKARSLRDESSLISEGAAIAGKNSVFKGCDLFVFRFDSFSPDELLLLKAAIRDAKSVTVSIESPAKYRRSAVSPFALCEGTVNSLIDLAEEVNSRFEYIYCDSPKTLSPAVAALGGVLFCHSRPAVKSCEDVASVRADTVYEEAEYVAAKIRELVFKEGFSFNDIAVITHDLESYAPALSAAFERYGIESFIDLPQPASEMSLSLFALDAIEAAATRVPNTDKILKYIRSPFSYLTRDEVSLLWDYCVRWNVEGEMWLEDFTASENSDLAAVNAARKKAIEPLMKLHEASKSASAGQIASAFCDFLKDVKAAEQAFEVIEDCAEDGLRLETARLFKQLWNALMSAVSSIYLIAGEEKTTLRSFGELLKTVLSQISLASPPQKLESVTVADVERSVIAAPRAAFVVGLADGLFPADVKKAGLFSGRDLAALEEVGLNFELTPEARLCAERFDCYKALTAPKERLYLSFSGSDLKGSELRPSRFITRAEEYLGIKTVAASSFGAKFYCSTPASAFYNYAVARGLSSSEKASVGEALKTLPEYAEKLSRLKNIGWAHRLSPDISKRLFAPKDINVTASRIDVYNRCAFEYFCKYGLKIQPVKPLTVDPANRGTVMHFLFQSVLEYFGAGFSEASDDEINLLIQKLLEEYSESSLGGDFGKSAKFKADYARLGSAAYEIILNMREEFKVSKFRPERFEYDLSQKSGESVLSISVGRGVSVNIRGIVDRVDTYTSPDGKRYIRVIDYKTGSKKFSFDDIYNGVNLQLLLYMLALTEGGDPDFKDCVPSGVLYMRSGFLECKDDFDPLSADSKARLKRCSEQLKRNGLIVDIPEAVSAMDESFSGFYVPVKKKADGSYSAGSEIIGEKSFKLLEEFAKQKVVSFGLNLLAGRIDAVPIGDDPEHLHCAYCDYASVCDRKKYIYKLISAEDGERLKAEISLKGAEGDV